MEFHFSIGPLHRPELQEQLARGIDLRQELRSRDALPKLWKATDKLNAYAAKGRPRPLKKKILGIIFVVLGALLGFTGFAMDTGINGPMIGGGMAFIVGLTYLMPQTAGPSRKCYQLAEKLLAMRQKISPVTLTFTEAGMALNQGEPIAYEQMDGMLESRDLYMLFINNSVMFLCKDEAEDVDLEAYSAFLQAQPSLKFMQIEA